MLQLCVDLVCVEKGALADLTTKIAAVRQVQRLFFVQRRLDQWRTAPLLAC